MDLIQWDKWYKKIINQFGYDSSEDEKAAIILDHLLNGKQISIEHLHHIIRNQPTIIFGAGPSLESDIKQITKTNLFSMCQVIAADGATSGLLAIAKKTPDIIVTDLDGKIDDLNIANRKGAIMVIHAHGDNIPQLNNYVKDLKNIIGTTQVNPIGELHNFGGFTDGDRAVILAEILGGTPIAMAGMDLGDVAGTYSKTSVPSIKIKKMKLKFCKDILEWQAANSSTKMFNLTGNGENILGVPRITPDKFEKILRKQES